MSKKPIQYWEFEGFRLDRSEGGCLWKDGAMVTISPKAIEILRVLVERQGRVVSRNELLETVWPDTFVEEGNINYTISLLRKGLRDSSAKKTEFIRTVPKTGYMFVPPAREVSESPFVEGHADERRRKAPVWSRLRPQIQIVGVVLLLLVTASAFFWNRNDSSGVLSVSPKEREIKSIAVFPPVDLNRAEPDEVMQLAVADAVINRLQKLDLFVIRPLSATIPIEDSDLDEISFARNLSSDAILSGSIVRENERLRISYRLLDVRDSAVLWSESIDSTADDLLTLQELVAAVVAKGISRKFTGNEDKRVVERPTTNDEAYRLYLRGKYFLKTREFAEGPAASFRQALSLDPDFAEAYVGLADALAFLEPPQPELENALENAIRLDPDLAEAWATRGFVRMFHHWDWAGAEASFKKAIELEPYNSKARHWYGVFHSLMGDLEKAREEMSVALELDPSSTFIRRDIAELSYYEGDLKKAEELAQQLISLSPTHGGAKELLRAVSLAKGDRTTAAKYAIAAAEGDRPLFEKYSRAFEAGGVSGLMKAKREYFGCRATRSTHPVRCADTFLEEGNNGEALRLLEQGAEERRFMLPFVAVDPFWNGLRHEPRFKTIVKQLKLPERSR